MSATLVAVQEACGHCEHRGRMEAIGSRNRLSGRPAGLALVGLVGMLVCLAVASRSEARAAGYCPSFAGPKWTLTGKYALPGVASQRTGSQYTLLAVGVTCPAALTFTKKLVGTSLAKRTPRADIPMKGAPAGYRCTGRSDSFGHAYSGVCFTNKHQIYFTWNPKLTTAGSSSGATVG
jgi:hypothetical protein